MPPRTADAERLRLSSATVVLVLFLFSLLLFSQNRDVGEWRPGRGCCWATHGQEDAEPAGGGTRALQSKRRPSHTRAGTHCFLSGVCTPGPPNGAQVQNKIQEVGQTNVGISSSTAELAKKKRDLPAGPRRWKLGGNGIALSKAVPPSPLLTSLSQRDHPPTSNSAAYSHPAGKAELDGCPS